MAEEKCEFKTSIGGQALIEGILMRGPDKQAIVCRTPEGIEEKTEDIVSLKEKHPIFTKPFLRGIAVLFASLQHGMNALTFSASLQTAETEESSKFEKWLGEKLGVKKAEKLFMALALIIGLFLAIFLFTFLPTFISGLFPIIGKNLFLRSFAEGVLKLIIFFLYLYACSKLPDMQRVFGYHGAEHKSIFCYENCEELTVENVRKQSRFHPRCGTSFLIVVVILGIFLGFLIRFQNTLIRILFRILLLPILVGIAYEINHWVGANCEKPLAKILSAPGRLLQRLTTNEPDDEMIECAILALKRVIPAESGKDTW